MRVQLNRIRSVAGLSAGIAFVSLTAVLVSNQLKVTVKAGATNVVADMVDIADDAGRIKVFTDVDDFLSQGAKLAAFNTAGMAIAISNLALLDPALFTGDYVKRTQSQIAAFGTNKIKLQATSAALGTTIGLLTSNTAAEIAFKAEKVLQKGTVDAQVTWVTSEIARLTALLPV